MYDAESIAALLRTPGETRDRIGEPYPFRNEKRREVTTEWVVGPGHTDPDRREYGEEGEIVISMTTFHYSDRKQYNTTARVEFVGGNMRQTTIAFGARGEAVNVLRTPVARFSAKTMREHHAECQRVIEEEAMQCGNVLAQGVQQYLPAEVVA